MDNTKKQTVPDRFASGWLEALDYRTALARQMRDRFITMTDDLGGLEGLSYSERSLCERALWLEYWLASQERDLAAGEPFDVGKWTQACNALQGIFAKLGLKRRKREGPDLTEFLARRAAEQAEQAAANE